MGKRVLIVEDEIVSAMALGKMLESIGCSIAGTVVTGEESIEWAKRLRPDIVAMDILLAGKMDGIEAASRIAEETGAPIVFMTGCDDEETRGRALALKPLGFLSKPIDRRRLPKLFE
jgi:CheY-like chemotaxis protein